MGLLYLYFYTLYRKPDGPQRQTGDCGEGKEKSVTLLEMETWGVHVPARLLGLVIPELFLIHLGCICYRHNQGAAP
jgi:hypothetical protein